jgi:hypothetical protein
VSTVIGIPQRFLWPQKTLLHSWVCLPSRGNRRRAGAAIRNGAGSVEAMRQ